MAHSDKPKNADAPLSKHSDSHKVEETRVPAKQKEAELTPIEQWAQSIINKTEPKIDPNSTESLSHYGLQNSKDVIAFLRSPEGKSLLAEINEEMALQKARIEQQHIAQLEHDNLMHRLKAAFFLWVMEEKSATAHQLKDFVLKQTEKAIKESGTSAKPTTQSPEYHNLAKAIANYDKAIQVNQQFIEQIKNQNADLNQQLVQLGQQRVALEENHNAQVNAIDEFNAFLAAPQNRGNPIEQRIAEINNEMERNNRAMMALVDHDENEENLAEARKIGARNEDLNLLLGLHHDMLAVETGSKHYINSEGQRVDSVHEAHFVIPTERPESQQRVVKDGGKYYLLRPGEDLTSSAVRDQAEKRFSKREAEMLVVKHLIENIFGSRVQMHAVQVTVVQSNIAANNEVLAKAMTHNLELQASRAMAQTQLNKLGLTPPVPVPSPSPAVAMGHFAAPAPRPAPWNAFYQTLIELSERPAVTKNGQELTQITREEIKSLVSLAPPASQKRFNAFLTSDQSTVNLNDPRNTPISYQKMQTLLRNMAYMGGDPTYPAVSNLKNALNTAKSAAVLAAQPTPAIVAPEREERSKTAPNPFNIDPLKGG